jgi:hypothetical protein
MEEMIMFEINELDEMREDIYLVLDDNGVWNTKEEHWMTEDELYALSDDEVIDLYYKIYGRR